jgi:hypothetical protein
VRRTETTNDMRKKDKIHGQISARAASPRRRKKVRETQLLFTFAQNKKV